MGFDDIRRLVAPLAVRISNLVARAVVQLADDAPGIQALQLAVLDEETREKVEHFQPYGFTSVPKKDAEGVVLFVGGQRDHGIAIVVDDRRYRVKNLESGEVAVYDATGSKLLFKQNGDVEVTPSSGVMKVNGDVHAVSGATTISLLNHEHLVAGNAPPGGGAVVFTPVGKTGGPT